MNAASLAFLAGIALVQQWARLPSPLEWALMVLLAAAFGFWRWRLGCLLLLGALWGGVYAQWRLSDSLVDGLQGKDVTVRGYVASLPKQRDDRTGFDFIVTAAPDGIPGKLGLNWYAPQTSIRAGQGWEMTVRLKKPHGRVNPGGFDYEAWLFANHVGAMGYVRAKPGPRRITSPFAAGRYLAQGRQRVVDRLEAALPGSEWLGVIEALAIGSQDAISQRQWELFRATGIVHLMVISGSHISLVAGLVFLLVRWLWIRSGLLSVSAQTVAASAAWLAALSYTALAGFSIPTQRALVMLTVGLWAIAWQRNTSPPQVLLIALLAVVLFDPLALLSVGFWLSFAAVALLIYMSEGRLARSHYLLEATKLHVAMAIGLSPLLIVFFQQVSLVSPLANWLAVPLVGLLLTPLILLAALVALFSSSLAALILWPVDRALQGLGWLLQQMASWPAAMVSCPEPPWYALSFAVLGILLLLAPRGMPGRYLALFLWLPLLFVDIDRPKPGAFWLTLLDVGQGLSAVVETANHVLVYDTGPRYSEQSDSGETVILPYLRHRGIARIDHVLISHGDNDHSGGTASLLAGMSVGAVYSSTDAWATRAGGHDCKAGQRWQWDGVAFEMLAPSPQGFDSENDNSCVLKVSASGKSLLLAGDIGFEAERWLVEHYGPVLASSVLVAPHHGSNTSSHVYFLDRVAPDLILIPAGHGNRFGFPGSRVLKRYDDRRMAYLTSGETGAITVKMSGEAMRIELARQDQKRYWME